jgi:hypothetical protein
MFGPVTEVPFATDVIDKKEEYKVLVDITSPSANPKRLVSFLRILHALLIFMLLEE